MPNPVLTEGTGEKAAGDAIRFGMDFGDEPLLIQGNTIVSKNVTTSGSGAPTISAIQLDYAYQVSAKISGGSVGTYGITFTITLDDPDSSEISRTGILKIY